MSKKKNWRSTRAYRLWRAKVVRRDKVCIICNSRKQRQAHHIEDGSNNPDLRFDIENGATLCRPCHTSFHTDYKKSYRYKTTRYDLENYIEIFNYAFNKGKESKNE